MSKRVRPLFDDAEMLVKEASSLAQAASSDEEGDTDRVSEVKINVPKSRIRCSVRAIFYILLMKKNELRRKN